MAKSLVSLANGDIVRYIGLDMKLRELTFSHVNGWVRCVVGQGYTPNLVFIDEGGRMMHAPLAAWLKADIQYEIIEKGAACCMSNST